MNGKAPSVKVRFWLPTRAQIDYAGKLMAELGYEDSDVHEIFGKDFDDLAKDEMGRLIDILKKELEG